MKYAANIKTTAAQQHYYRVPSDVVAEFLAYLRAQRIPDIPESLTPATLSLSYETALGDVEDAATPVISRIIASESLHELASADRLALSVFLAVQSVRTPSTRRNAANASEQLRTFVSEHARAAGHDPAHVLAVMGADTASAASPPHTALSLLETAPAMAPLFAEKTWVLLRTTNATLFVIGDNPLTRISHQPLNVQQVRGTLGLRSLGIELAMPLSPTLCLLMLCPTVAARITAEAARLAPRAWWCVTAPVEPGTWQLTAALAQSFRTGDPVDIAPIIAAEYNARQVDAAERQVMSNSADFEFVEPLLNSDPGR